jgi:hypothetical protein
VRGVGRRHLPLDNKLFRKATNTGRAVIYLSLTTEQVHRECGHERQQRAANGTKDNEKINDVAHGAHGGNSGAMAFNAT